MKHKSRVAPLPIRYNIIISAPGHNIDRILYTDGITEARHNNNMFGSEGIERVLQEHGSLLPGELLDHLVTAATEWANGHLMDDTAVLVIEWCERTDTSVIHGGDEQ